MPRVKGLHKMDVTTDPRALPPGSYRHLVNGRIGSTDSDKSTSITNIKGNLLKNNTLLPAGTNDCIGSLEDKINRKVYYFVWNSNSNHSIFSYHLDTEDIELVFQTPLLNFDRNVRIYNPRINGDLLYWVNREPYKLNVAKANNTDKEFILNIYFGDGSNYEDVFADGNTFTIEDTVTVALIYTASGITSFSDGLDAYVAELNNYLGSNAATHNGSYVTYRYTANAISIIEAASSTGHVWSVYQNAYEEDFHRMYVDLVKYAPAFPVLPVLKNDAKRPTNHLQGEMLQFRTRYVFDDNEKSTWGPWSKVALSTVVSNTDLLKPRKNYVELDYSDNGLLFTKHYRNMVKKVEIGFRQGNTGRTKSIVTLEQYELTGIFNFYNDGFYSVVDESEANTLYYAVPDEVGCMELADNRLILGDITEGYDEVPVDLRIGMDFNDDPQQDTWTIRGKIIIQNVNVNARLGTQTGDNLAASLWQQIYEIDDVLYFGGFLFEGGGDDRADLMGRMKQILPAGGFVVYLAGTPYYAISEYQNTPQNTPWGTQYISTFEITGVPPGTYTARIASHLCDSGGTYGEIYNLDSANLAWQQTSTFVKMFAGKDSMNNGDYEHTFTLGAAAPGGSFYDFYDNALGLSNDGFIMIADLSWDFERVLTLPDDISGAFFGYAVEDTNGTNDKENMAAALRCEGQVFQWETSAAGVKVYTLILDHNGFFWATAQPLKNNLPLQPAFHMHGSFRVSGKLLMDFKEMNDEFFIGSIADPDALVPSLFGASNIPANYPYAEAIDEAIEVVLYVTQFSTAKNLRTTLTGKVVDTSGDPIEDVPVIFTHTGRHAYTDSNGDFELVVYERFPGSGQGRKTDTLVINSQETLVPQVTPFTGYNPAGLDSYDFQTPFYVSPNSTASVFPVDPFILAIEETLVSALKRGGRYIAGLVYFKTGNRSTATCTAQKNAFYIPFFTEDLNKYFPNQFAAGTYKFGQPVIDWAIHHRPPSGGFTHYQIVLTRVNNISYYLQAVISGAQYVDRFDNSLNDPLVTSSFSSSTAQEIYLDLKTLQYFKEEHTDSQLGYTWQQGDRMRVIRTANGNLTEYFDLEIKGIYGQKIIVENLLSLPELSQGALIEIYRTKLQVEDNIFFEIGEAYEIGEDADGLYHKGSTQDQAGDLSQPATGTFTEGDTYWRRRPVRTVDEAADPDVIRRYNYYVEDASASDYFPSQHSHIGRPNAIDKNFKRIRRRDAYRFSNVYSRDNNVNGFSAFEPLNIGRVAYENGAITGMRLVDYVLFIVQEHRSNTVYYNTNVLQGANDEQIVSISDKVINNTRVLRRANGCQDPGSIIMDSGRVYFWDRHKSEVIRYSNNGLTNILHEMDTDFKLFSAKMNHPDSQNVRALAVFDTETNQYLLSLQYAELVADVLTDMSRVYNFWEGASVEGPSYWTGYHEYTPESFCTAGRVFVAFKNGQLYLHHANPLRCNFFGVQKKLKLRLIFNAESDAVKIFQSMDLQTNKPWDIPVITTPATDENPDGQLSELIKADFAREEGVYKAGFWFNKNTPNIANPLIQGEEMRGQYIDLELENDATDEVVLYSYNVNYVQSYLLKQ